MSAFGERYAGTWQGSSSFRVFPHEELADAPSTLTVTSVAGGVGTTLAFTWVHPEDGEQHGHLLVGAPADGAVAAAYLDSWHQQAGPATLTGTGDDERLDVSYEYAPGWRWRITVTPTDDGLAMRMSNTVPDGVEGAPAGEYDVAQAAWRFTSH